MGPRSDWPGTAEELVAVQRRVAETDAAAWRPAGDAVVAGCFVCFPRGYRGPGAAGDAGWAAAAAYQGPRRLAGVVVAGRAGGAYVPGLLALRMGALLDAAVCALPAPPDVLLVDGTGADHPRAAGLARHLGAVLDLPTAGVTHRPLLASGPWPRDDRGDRTPLRLDRRTVAYWVRTRSGCRPLVAHSGWRTTPETAAGVVLATAHYRTPTPLREARRLARTARANAIRAGGQSSVAESKCATGAV